MPISSSRSLSSLFQACTLRIRPNLRIWKWSWIKSKCLVLAWPWTKVVQFVCLMLLLGNQTPVRYCNPNQINSLKSTPLTWKWSILTPSPSVTVSEAALRLIDKQEIQFKETKRVLNSDFQGSKVLMFQQIVSTSKRQSWGQIRAEKEHTSKLNRRRLSKLVSASLMFLSREIGLLMVKLRWS